ncbi:MULTISPECIES: DUF1440 domain-containing protein [unclassified Lysobacter]|uniref:DUF1440 domain-containing protein n=1 Tax=unclassified Lysobacter TaxID=2635362 RepID=UPI001C23F3D6|nr:DUF1440 domain-containing protein [Lysobacter sp. MMG2]MBU8977900.1 DUF1440 domain-containing protein [Lysobacter sp. MMG2]
MASIRTYAAQPIAWGAVLLGGLLVALGDFIFATTLWFSWDAAGLERVFQTIAVGVLGQASFDGGLRSATLGAVLHVLMATVFVLIYTLVARRNPKLLARPILLGIAYGVVLYVVMNFVVMPLSRVGRSPSFAHPDWIAYSVLAHMLFGVICVLFARRALRRG